MQVYSHHPCDNYVMEKDLLKQGMESFTSGTVAPMTRITNSFWGIKTA